MFVLARDQQRPVKATQEGESYFSRPEVITVLTFPSLSYSITMRPGPKLANYRTSRLMTPPSFPGSASALSHKLAVFLLIPLFRHVRLNKNQKLPEKSSRRWTNSFEMTCPRFSIYVFLTLTLLSSAWQVSVTLLGDRGTNRFNSH